LRLSNNQHSISQPTKASSYTQPELLMFCFVSSNPFLFQTLFVFFFWMSLSLDTSAMFVLLFFSFSFFAYFLERM